MPLPIITDLDSLIANVSDYLARDDIAYAYGTHIQNAEARLNSVLKVPGMEKAATLALDAAGTVALPADFVEWVMAQHSSGGGTPRLQRMRYVEANSAEFTYRYRPNGDPQFYTIAGGKLQIVPARAGSVILTYYSRLPALTTAAPTNWLLQKSPHVYLYSVLAEAYAFQKDEAKAAEWMKAADERLKQFLTESNTGKVGRRAERAAEDAADALAAQKTS